MNCLECGHFIAMHSKYLRACQNHSCKCELTPEEIELHYWRAEAMAARKLIDKVTLYNPDTTKQVTYRRSYVRDELNTYLAARVTESKETT